MKMARYWEEKNANWFLGVRKYVYMRRTEEKERGLRFLGWKK
jgi:hypothetical protein